MIKIRKKFVHERVRGTLKNNLIFLVSSLRLIYVDYPIIIKISLENIIWQKKI